MVVFLYTAPIFAALGLHWWLPVERLAPLQWAGIALAFTGIGGVFPARQPGRGAGLAAHAVGPALPGCWPGGVGRHDGADPCHAAEQPARVANAALPAGGGFRLWCRWPGGGHVSAFHGTPAVWASLAFQSVVVVFRQFPAVVLAAA